MTREEFDLVLRAELAILMQRDVDVAEPAQLVASWAFELTDMLRQPVIVMPVFVPVDGVYQSSIIAYAVPVPAPLAVDGSTKEDSHDAS